jgi:hypothetical protein
MNTTRDRYRGLSASPSWMSRAANDPPADNPPADSPSDPCGAGGYARIGRTFAAPSAQSLDGPLPREPRMSRLTRWLPWLTVGAIVAVFAANIVVAIAAKHAA